MFFKPNPQPNSSHVGNVEIIVNIFKISIWTTCSTCAILSFFFSTPYSLFFKTALDNWENTPILICILVNKYS